MAILDEVIAEVSHPLAAVLGECFGMQKGAMKGRILVALVPFVVLLQLISERKYFLFVFCDVHTEVVCAIYNYNGRHAKDVEGSATLIKVDDSRQGANQL